MKKIFKYLFSFLLIVPFMVALTACDGGGGGGPQGYNVSFYVDGELYESKKTNELNSNSIPQNPQKEGYTFFSWYERNLMFEIHGKEDNLGVVTQEYFFDAIFIKNSFIVSLKSPFDSNPPFWMITEGQLSCHFYIFYEDNQIEEINIDDLINVSADVDYYATKDIAEITNTKTIQLENGATNFYLVITDNEEDKFVYNFIVQKPRINTISFDTKGGTPIDSYQVKDGEFISEPQIQPTKPGYVFAGWEGDTIIFEGWSPVYSDYTFTAIWEPEEYTVYYYDGLQLVNSQLVEFNSKYTIAYFDKYIAEGYRYVWNDKIDGTGNDYEFSSRCDYNVVGDTNLYLTARTVYYTINYNLNEGHFVNGEEVITEYNIETPTFALQEPIRDHFDFGGWELEGEIINNFEIGKTGDKYLSAIWIPHIYNITYHMNGGERSDSNPTTIDASQRYVNIGSPVFRDFYVFVGWHLKADLSDEALYLVDNQYKDIDVYAEWDLRNFYIQLEIPEEDVIYDDNRLEYYDGYYKYYRMQYNIETETFTIPTPTKFGYTFSYYVIRVISNEEYRNEENSHILEITQGTKYQDITLRPIFTVNTYNITYHLDGGTFKGAPTTYNIRDWTEIGSPEKKGYIFEGWFTDENFEKPLVLPRTEVGDIDLYAKWQIETYTITYELDGGEFAQGSQPVTTYTYLDEEIELLTPVKEGYSLWFWKSKYTTKQFENSFSTSDICEDLTLIAVWISNDVKVELTLHYNDDVTPTKTLILNRTTGILVQAPEARKGYTFWGWYTSPDFVSSSKVGEDTKNSTTYEIMYTSIEENYFEVEEVSLYAKWTVTTFYVDLDYDMLSQITEFQPEGYNWPDSIEFTIFDEDIYLPEINKPGWVFMGWTKFGTVIPAGTALEGQTHITIKPLFREKWETNSSIYNVLDYEEVDITPFDSNGDGTYEYYVGNAGVLEIPDIIIHEHRDSTGVSVNYTPLKVVGISQITFEYIRCIKIVLPNTITKNMFDDFAIIESLQEIEWKMTFEEYMENVSGARYEKDYLETYKVYCLDENGEFIQITAEMVDNYMSI